MAALTPLGIVHTAISIVALISGAVSLVRYKDISPGTKVGRLYVLTTILTCLTGFGIFQHGGFGKPHALGIITLAVLGVAWLAGRRSMGRLSPYIATVSYSLTYFFHLVPGITETTTRLPVSGPLASGPDDPHIQAAIGLCFILFLLFATWQVFRMRGSMKAAVAS